jgi:aspartate carbamoyltransferase catalytic subunit
MTRHLLSAAGLSRDEATAILDDADRFSQALLGREVKKLPTLRGRTVITMFYENSTRTRVSFEVAGKWMSADVINVSSSGSSVAKGESLRDTALTLRAAGADALIIRHPASGAAQQLAEWTAEGVDRRGAERLGELDRRAGAERLGELDRRAGAERLGELDRRAGAERLGELAGGPSVINAGDGTHEHPTQALLDALTIRQRLGSVEGKRVVIVGDVLHSRVARSNVLLLSTLGAEVVLVAPPTLLPVGVETWPVTVSHDLDAELPAADAVLMLRVQAERMNGGFFPSAREYSVLYGLSEKRSAKLSAHAVVLHPGPMLRGMEIASSVADSSQSAVLQQVSNGVHVRMAVLFHLLVGAGAEVNA